MSARARSLGINPQWCEMVTFLESNFNPQARNPNSTAQGLWQWIRATRTSLGYGDVWQQSAEQQINGIWTAYVRNQLRNFKRAKTFVDFYLCVFYPAAVNAPDTYVFSRSVWLYNKTFDINRDQRITKNEFSTMVAARLKRGGYSLNGTTSAKNNGSFAALAALTLLTLGS